MLTEMRVPRLFLGGVVLAGLLLAVVPADEARADRVRVRASGNGCGTRSGWCWKDRTPRDGLNHTIIHKGDRVVWKNPTTVAHDVKSTQGDWRRGFRRILQPGESTSKRFRRRGFYYYKCTFHDGMTGLIHVKR